VHTGVFTTSFAFAVAKETGHWVSGTNQQIAAKNIFSHGVPGTVRKTIQSM
jgi:hypothetical protein